MKRKSVLIGAVVWLLVIVSTTVSALDNENPKTLIPIIGNIAGIKIGYSSMGELEAILGKGKAITGGHPNGARLWRVRETSWVISADAFEYSERGAVVDSFDITLDPNAGQDVPYARLAKDKFSWSTEITLGMGEEKLLKTLKRNSCTATKHGDGWLVEAKGFSPLTSDPLYPIQEWAVRFEIKEKILTGLWLDARPRIASK